MTESQIIRSVWEIFQKEISLQDPSYRLFLFGSRAKGLAKEFSDFDFCIVGPHPVAPTTLSRFRAKVMALKTLYTIDIVDLTSASEDLKISVSPTMKEISNGQIRT